MEIARDCLIRLIKAKFETIETIVGNTLEANDLEQPKFLRALIAATESTYLALNDGMCESLQMCKECAKRRDMLMEYLQLFDDIERKKIDAHTVAERIEAYPETIMDVLKAIDHVLASV